tara:strand:- start:2102 stop:2953 length:852 start_codon:yes stop_codon:yes gene_type:complete
MSSPIVTRNPSFGPALRTSNAPPASVISKELQEMSSLTPILQYPPDLPKYYVLLTQSAWRYSAALTLQKAYRLPLPTRLVDAHEVMYDHHFNWTDMLANISGVQRAAGILGYSVGNFKTVTVQTPQFRTFSMEWKFAPRNARESQTIREIYNGIKQGMHPIAKASFTVLEFPSIFWLGIYPNAGWLFKMKPAVISGCQIDYQGGNPQPAFYKGTMAPESIVLRLSFIEIEYWLANNFDNVMGDYPFDASARYFSQNPPTAPPGTDPTNDPDSPTFDPDVRPIL